MFNYSEYDQFELGSSPSGEDCVQVNQRGDYLQAMRDEVRRFKAMLEKRFPQYEQFDAKFKITTNPHDFGVYYEVAVRYNTLDEASIDFASFVESNVPEKWDDERVCTIVPNNKDLTSPMNAYEVTCDDGFSYITSANGTLEEFTAYIMQDGGVLTYENPATGVETRRVIVKVEVSKI